MSVPGCGSLAAPILFQSPKQLASRVSSDIGSGDASLPVSASRERQLHGCTPLSILMPCLWHSAWFSLALNLPPAICVSIMKTLAISSHLAGSFAIQSWKSHSDGWWGPISCVGPTWWVCRDPCSWGDGTSSLPPPTPPWGPSSPRRTTLNTLSTPSFLNHRDQTSGSSELRPPPHLVLSTRPAPSASASWPFTNAESTGTVSVTLFRGLICSNPGVVGFGQVA